MASIMSVRKGDIIVERINGKKRLIPVRQLEYFACSSRGVHVNRNACYDRAAQVEFVPGEGTLEDLQEEIESKVDDLEEAFPSDEDLYQAGINSVKAWASHIVKV